MVKYKKMWIPELAFNNFKQTQRQMEDEYKKQYGKKKRIPMTKIIVLKSQLSLFLSNIQLKKMATRKFIKEDLFLS
jgi:hypothetical protein